MIERFLIPFAATALASMTIAKAWELYKGRRNLANAPYYKRQFFPLIRAYCRQWKIPFSWGLALIATENAAYDAGATRYEPEYYERYIRGVDRWTVNPYYGQPEKIASSYGLTQIMYPAAVEMGYPASAAPDGLLNPTVNLNLGLKYFSLRCYDRTDAFLSYLRFNAGPSTTRENASMLALRNARRFVENLSRIQQAYSLT